MITSTKTYGNERGLSVTFRQHRAKSHCALLHGYSLGFEITFSAETLDANGWVQDFGGLDEVADFLRAHFDHKLAAAADDPELEAFEELAQRGVVDLVVFDEGVGLERFATRVGTHVDTWASSKSDGRVRCLAVRCFEHASNAATWTNDELNPTTAALELAAARFQEAQ